MRAIALWGDRDSSALTCSPSRCVCMSQEPTGAGANISQGAECCVSHGCWSYLCYGWGSQEEEELGREAFMNAEDIRSWLLWPAHRCPQHTHGRPL